MVSWYYVQGSERVGPVGVEILKNLFLKAEINLDSYVWRKGFQNWERLKDVSELDFSVPNEISIPKIEKPVDKTFNLDWKTVRDEDELFFIKTGHDRKNQLASELFGPYSLKELRDAISEKRINNQSLVFTPGMPGWIKVGDTPLDPKNLELNTSNILNEAPLFIVVENEPLPLIALVREAGLKKCTLLGAGPFKVGKVVTCSIYSGMALKTKNLKLNIEEYRPREQKIFCSVVDINESAKKIMQNYAG